MSILVIIILLLIFLLSMVGVTKFIAKGKYNELKQIGDDPNFIYVYGSPTNIGRHSIRAAETDVATDPFFVIERSYQGGRIRIPKEVVADKLFFRPVWESSGRPITNAVIDLDIPQIEGEAIYILVTINSLTRKQKVEIVKF